MKNFTNLTRRHATGELEALPVAIEEAALRQASVFLNGGQRGLQVELDPNDAVKAAGAIVRALTV